MTDIRVVKNKTAKYPWDLVKLYVEGDSPTEVVAKIKNAVPADEWLKIHMKELIFLRNDYYGGIWETHWWHDKYYEDSVKIDKTWFRRRERTYVGDFRMKNKEYDLKINVSRRKGKWYGRGIVEMKYKDYIEGKEE